MSGVFSTAIIGACCIAGLVLFIPIMAILTYHRRKLEELRMRHNVSILEETRAAIESVRREVAALRDTTTEYDVSFDTALHRLESRMGHVEQRVNQMERGQESLRLGAGREDLHGV